MINKFQRTQILIYQEENGPYHSYKELCYALSNSLMLILRDYYNRPKQSF